MTYLMPYFEVIPGDADWPDAARAATWHSGVSGFESPLPTQATDDDAHPEDAESEEAFAERMLGTKEDVVEGPPKEEDDD